MSKKKKPSKKQAKKAILTLRHGLIGVVIALFGFLIYTNTLGHEYTLDDFSAIKENYITKQGIEGIPTIWKEHYRFGYWNSSASLYRPIPLTIFALVWQVSPDNTFLYHLINILAYAATGMLLFLVLCRLMPKQNTLLPMAATLLYIAHPLHVEVVANIKSLDDILVFLLCLKTIYLLWNYLDTKKIGYLIASLFAYGIALFSKESGITFVAIFPLLLYFFRKESLLNSLKMGALYLIPAAVFLIARYQVVGSFGVGSISFLDNAILHTNSPINQLATSFLFLGKYLFNLIAPYQLSHDFGYSQIQTTTFADWRVLLSLLLYSAMGIYALITFKDRNYTAFGILFFFLTFSIASNVVIKIGTSYGDRILYLASFGFCFAFVHFIFKLLKVDTQDKKSSLVQLLQKNILPVGIVGVLVLLFAIKTITRNPVWENSYTLYNNDIKIAPNSAKLNYHHGLELIKQGIKEKNTNKQQEWYNKGQQAFENAIKIHPAYHDAYGQLGLAYYRKKEYDKAMQYYQKAIELKPNSPKVYSNMGIIYFQHRNDLPKAKEVYEKAVRLDPRYVDALRNLGTVNAIMQDFPNAIKYFSQALQYAPNDATLNNYLGSAYRDSGQASKGQAYLDKACRLDAIFCK